MATIGTFKKTGSEYTGEIFTLSLQAKGVRLVSDLRASGENAPSHRVLVGRAEIGAAWTKNSNVGRIPGPEAGRSELRGPDLRQPLR